MGWIGRQRMAAMLATGAVEAAAFVEPSREMAAAAQELAPDAEKLATMSDLLDLGLDGVVIATPSALHAEQCVAALEHGAAVFCQKPLGRSASEVRSVIDAARCSDVLMTVDLSYRCTEAVRQVRDTVRRGELGRVFAADLVFHNAYGPDKPWFYDRELSGGGCVMDLGVHLVDLALWVLGYPEVSEVSADLLAQGSPLDRSSRQVEDYAVATLKLAPDAIVRLACSWRLQAGRDAEISAAFYGTEGGAAVRNVDGSFYDFVAERYRGVAREALASPPDDWGGRAAADWARRLSAGQRFDPEAERLVQVAEVLDLIYGR